MPISRLQMPKQLKGNRKVNKENNMIDITYLRAKELAKAKKIKKMKETAQKALKSSRLKPGNKPPLKVPNPKLKTKLKPGIKKPPLKVKKPKLKTTRKPGGRVINKVMPLTKLEMYRRGK
tara:strand:+ start:64 stop:423 length:360 start_codon:yes stop_codon:yes gene_type:complete